MDGSPAPSLAKPPGPEQGPILQVAGLNTRFDVVLLAPGRLPCHAPDAWRD